MSDPGPSVLVIEDDSAIRKFLRAALTAQDYRVHEALTAKEGLSVAALYTPDLIILDLGLPDADGVALTRQLREWSKTPIIVVSARGKEQDKVQALDAGADDYLTKPFAIGELLARLRAALRRREMAANTASPAATFSTGELHVDLARRLVTVSGKEVHLTPTEYKLLVTLIHNAGCVLTHRDLLREVWGPDANQELHYLRVYMNQLRQKLEPDPTQPRYLLTEPGIGYRLQELAI
ncbi:MAG TPA: response regulator [Phycisphaerae bacterium]|nr:response regulator [Phycisphaerae bacterium]